MSSKYARNAPCPCGSGKKYKFCHGAAAQDEQAQGRSVEMGYRFHSIMLTHEKPEKGGGQRVVVHGALMVDPTRGYPFLMVVEPKGKELEIKQFGWQVMPPITDKAAVARQLLVNLGECLKPMAALPRFSEEEGPLQWVSPTPEQTEDPHLVVLRPALSRLPGAPWAQLWDRIELTRRHEELFRVAGFEAEQVERAFAGLREVFSPQWLEGVFRAAEPKELAERGMSATLTPGDSQAWFPAYHLSRLAMNVICRDPVLNILVDLGLALQDLEGVPGLPAFKQALAADPRLHHQALFAAHLHAQGLLTAFEEDARGDIRVLLDEQPYRLRTVAVNRHQLLDELRAQLQGGEGEAPLVLQAVLVDNGWYRPTHELPEELELLDIPADIHALALVNSLLDRSGGGVKRHARKLIVNPKAEHAPADSGVERLFAANYEELQEPAVYAGTCFYLA